MRLARGPEILLNAKVKLYPMAAEPAPATSRQNGRLLLLGQPQHPAIKLTQRRLAARRAAQLHMVNQSPSFLRQREGSGQLGLAGSFALTAIPRNGRPGSAPGSAPRSCRT